MTTPNDSLGNTSQPDKNPSPICPDDQTLARLCMGKADALETDRFILHLENCQLCPDRADAIWKTSSSPKTAKITTHLNFASPPNGLSNLLARAELERSGVAFLPPSPNTRALGRLGGYDLLRVIGTGGMGIVFEALSPDSPTPIALKTLKQGPTATTATRQRFLREARSIQSVRHNGLIPILDTGNDANIPFMIMPLLEGQNFERLIARQAPLKFELVVELARQICQALHAAHQAGVVHRDIKPSNLWLQPPDPSHPPGRALLLDFGLAQAEDVDATLTSIGVTLGTPGYLSPEQAEGKARVGPASDLFSLGCVLYEMASGRKVFPGVTTMEILRNIAAFNIVPPNRGQKRFPPKLNSLILSLLDHNPKNRPTSAQNLLAKLEDPNLLLQPLITRRSIIITASALSVAAITHSVWRAYQPKPISQLKPTHSFSLPGATHFCLANSGDPKRPTTEVIWADSSGNLHRILLDGSPSELMENVGKNIHKLVNGGSSVGICDTAGVVQFLDFGNNVRAKRKISSPLPHPLSDPPADFVFDPLESRFLLALGDQISIWPQSRNAQTDYYSPRCRARVTSFIPCPPTVGKSRHIAISMEDGTLGFLNNGNLLLYQEAIMENPMDFRIAIRHDGVEAAVWDLSGRIFFLQADSFTHRLRSSTLQGVQLPSLIAGQQIEASSLQPISINYALGGNLMALLGNFNHKNHALLFHSTSQKIVAQLAVENPLEMIVDNHALWILDSHETLHLFEPSTHLLY